MLPLAVISPPATMLPLAVIAPPETVRPLALNVPRVTPATPIVTGPAAEDMFTLLLPLLMALVLFCPVPASTNVPPA